jgi:murein DD-endopeptidase MepM/ murein hydrolase activator NlpD
MSSQSGSSPLSGNLEGRSPLVDILQIARSGQKYSYPHPMVVAGIILSAGMGLALTSDCKGAMANEVTVEAQPSQSQSATVTIVQTSSVALPVVGPQSVTVPVIPAILGQDETVRAGQTLTQVADFYKVDSDALAQVNQMPKVSVLKEGQVIRVPVGTQSAPKQVVSTSAVSRNLNPAANRVVANQVTVVASRIEPQQQAELVSGRSEDVVDATYRVNAGDTLTSIARNHGVSYRALAELNSITDPNQLFANRVLKLPKAIATIAKLDVNKIDESAISPEAFRQQLANTPTVPTVDFSAQLARPQGVLEDSAPQPQRTSFVPQAELVKQAQEGQAELTGSLATEVRNLRQKFQERTIVPAVLKPSVPTNLTLPASRASQSETAKRSKQLAMTLQEATQQSKKEETNDIPLPTMPSKQLVARSTLGAGEYAPVDAAVRRMVAPNLPALGREDAYLPGGQAMTGYIWPAKGEFTSPYGPRWGRMHRGIDVAAATGTPVVAAAPGVVSEVGWDGYGYGNYVEVTHPDGAVTLYGHNDRVLVRQGQVVAQGEQISEMGSTGRSTGPHLHFEIHPKGEGAVNPMAYLDRQGPS